MKLPFRYPFSSLNFKETPDTWGEKLLSDLHQMYRNLSSAISSKESLMKNELWTPTQTFVTGGKTIVKVVRQFPLVHVWFNISGVVKETPNTTYTPFVIDLPYVSEGSLEMSFIGNCICVYNKNVKNVISIVKGNSNLLEVWMSNELYPYKALPGNEVKLSGQITYLEG